METFCCHACAGHFNENRLSRRLTMPGDYCPACAAYEKCAACGEMCCSHLLTYMPDVQNYICAGCESDYKEVAEYIKPLYNTTEAKSRNLKPDTDFGNAA